ncbi:MAG: TonB-dependent receptor, partial [Smithellaceae bacterium]|nr:TonB-dependent receptor [Smithellaceae bacterium]
EPKRYFATPAAIYVITSEDIKRSGATSIPDVLRLIPGADVQRIDSNKWAVSIRGTASRFTRTVLVMIDGRTIYSPIFGGVYWEDNDVMLEDVDRIEVVRGPGGTYWGANAVSGVVNIITKNARDTQGGLVTLGAGTFERGFGSVRYGGKSADNLYYRVYAKYFDRDDLFHRNPDMNEFDEWRMGQTGFRADKDISERDTLTFQGDFHSARIGLYEAGVSSYSAPYTRVMKEKKASFGGNLLARWQRTLSEKSDLTLQLYYDKDNHRDIFFNSDTDTVDFDFHHRFAWIWHQQIVWGGGYRFIGSETSGFDTSFFSPADETFNLYNAFIQDDIELWKERLHFIIGSKFEHNDVTGFVIQPNARLLWTPTAEQTIWASVSRSVRTPSRFDYEYQRTTFGGLAGGTTPAYARIVNLNDKPQDVIAYELGHRIIFGSKLSLDTAAHYDIIFDTPSLELKPYFLETTPAPTHYIVPYIGDHKLMAKTYGGEISAELRPFAWWRLSASHAVFHLQVFKDADSTDPRNINDAARFSPRHQTVLRSYMDLPGNVNLDAMFRYVSEIPPLNVPSYYSLDARLAWKARPDLELSVVGQNLLDKEHPENNPDSEVPRGVYGMVRWQW